MRQGIHPRVLSATLISALLLLLASAAAWAGTSPAGQWKGSVKTPDGDKVEIKMILSQDNGVWSGTLEDPTLGETAIADLKVSETRISFTIKPVNAPFPFHFTGSYVAADDRVNGTFSVHGNSRFVKFERIPGTEPVAVQTDGQVATPKPVRHEHNFGLTVRGAYWAPLHVVKDETYNLNTMTTGDWGYDASLRWYLQDEFAILVRGWRGGQGMTDDQDKLDQFPGSGVSADSYFTLDGWEIALMGYLGKAIMPSGRFDPYITAGFGQVNWELNQNGRGSAPVVIDREPLEGTDFAVAFGIGTEYKISDRWFLELEVLWRYFLTADTTKWPDEDNVWSNTHAWPISLGLTFAF